MASFCNNCGFPLGASNAFCAQCGAKLQGAPTGPPPAAPIPPAPPVAAAAGSSGAKVVVIVLVCLMVGVLAAAGAVMYATHWVKSKVVEKAQTYGVDLRSHPSASNSSVLLKPACDFLSKSEAATLLDEPIERSESTDPESCMYYGPPGLSARLAKEGMADTMKRSEAPGSQVKGAEMADAVTNLLNNFAAQSGQGGSHGESPLLILVVAKEENGQTRMTALAATSALFSGLVGPGPEVPNLGDRAIWVGNLGLNVQKGNRAIGVIPGPVPKAHEKAVAVAREVLARL